MLLREKDIMKLVVWGLGYRGKTLVDYLGNQYVAAIIESDLDKIGKEYNGIRVIPFGGYMDGYQTLPIIITPEYQFQQEICQQLMKHNIFHFTYSSELPPNIRYNGKFKLDCYLDMMGSSNKIYLYGINAFSIILFLVLHKHVQQIIFVIEKDNMKENQVATIELLRLQIVSKEMLADVYEPIYITTHEYTANVDGMFLGKKVVDAFRYADSRQMYRNVDLKKFYNLYEDKQRCFIIATGPSLTMDDLNTLLEKQEFCFSVNGMCKTETKWKPNVYVVLDGKFFLENQEAIRNYFCQIKFLPDDNIDFWQQKREGEYQIHRDTLDAYEVMEFSEDITQIVNSQGTVTVGCIQIAVYMGFKKIYLLGTDCNYTIGSVNNHFGGDEKPDMIDHSVSAMLQGYQMCRNYADAHGIKIYNATRGGMLEVFERVDFDSLFEDK